MTNSEINRASARGFEHLLDSSWVARSQEDQDDYGIDFELEVIGSDDSPKGSPFKVQLKGVENGKYRKDGSLVFPHASVKKFKYYLQKLHYPLIFVVYDIRSKRCFWRSVHGSSAIENKFQAAHDNNHKTFTIDFSEGDEFTNDHICQAKVLGAVSRMVDIIALRRVESVPLGSIQHITSLSDDPLEIAEKLKRAASYAAMSSIPQLFKIERRDDAERISEELFRDPREGLEVRLHSGHWYLKCKKEKNFQDNLPEITQLNRELQLDLSIEMLQIVRHAEEPPWELRSYQKCFWRSSLLALDSYFLQSLYISDAVRLGGEGWFSPLIRAERELRISRISRCFASVMKEINVALDREDYAMIPNIWTDLAMAVKSFADACYAGKKVDYFVRFRESVDSFFPLAIYLSQFAGREDDAKQILLSCCVQFLGLSDFGNHPDIDNRVDTLKSLLEDHVRVSVVRLIEGELESVITKIKSYRASEESLKVGDQKRSFIEGQIIAHATAMGVDMNDPDSDEANLVRIGLKDADPTRVLKDCVHIHVTPDSIGVIGQMIGLSTAGSKQVHCLKHGHSSGGLCLDQTYEFFKGESPMPWGKKLGHSCLVCKDRGPHEEGWKWNQKWQEKQHAKYRATRSDT